MAEEQKTCGRRVGTLHTQETETSPRRSKVGPSDHPQAYKSPEIHLGTNLPPTFTPDEEHYEKEKRQRR